MNMKKGFTLIEIIVVLAIIGALAGSIVPLSLQFLESRREQATREETKVIFRAIFGDPKKGDFGYVGDAGALPASLNDLTTKPGGISSFAFFTNNVGYGWRGPYIDTNFSDLLDGFGNAYDFGVAFAGQIRSAGSDGDFATTGDNILFPFVSTGGSIETNGTLQVTVFVNDIPNPTGSKVEVFFATNGAENVTPISDTTPADGFKFSTHQGIHAVKVTHTSTDATPVVTTKTVNMQVVARRQVSEEVFIRTTGIVNP